MESAIVLFRTERLCVRRLDEKDTTAMFEVYGDPVGARWVDDGLPIKWEECVGWIAVTQRNYVKYGYGMSAIESLATGEVIGFCGLLHPGGQPQAEIKYSLRRAHWGQGLATEAVDGMMHYGQTVHRLPEIIATLSAENLASRRVLEKAGLRLAETHPNDDGTASLLMVWRDH